MSAGRESQQKSGFKANKQQKAGESSIVGKEGQRRKPSAKGVSQLTVRPQQQ